MTVAILPNKTARSSICHADEGSILESPYPVALSYKGTAYEQQHFRNF